MTNSAFSTAASTAAGYYDSNDADRFYAEIWGGEDINIHKFHCLETIKELHKLHNIIHVAISENIYNRLKRLHISALLVNFNLVKNELFFTYT